MTRQLCRTTTFVSPSLRQEIRCFPESPQRVERNHSFSTKYILTVTVSIGELGASHRQWLPSFSVHLLSNRISCEFQSTAGQINENIV
ncbi:hypothetical protein SCLCIDRAFT_1211891 [Scleroderma citrinum Foug A]|uniref:Uncharacterized protein n=1 Tax=Scleroderma citrinum Foug A TaxID=1036808 RepID=A0A0C3DZ88_9AGAM|nr:hypothetical protein SCLCIDRAFT_1211891 [Scleroderma citrinum Foug A]